MPFLLKFFFIFPLCATLALTACKVVSFPDDKSEAEQCYKDALLAQNKGFEWFIKDAACGEPFYYYVSKVYNEEKTPYCLPRHDNRGRQIAAEALTVEVARETSFYLMRVLSNKPINPQFSIFRPEIAAYYLSLVCPCN